MLLLDLTGVLHQENVFLVDGLDTEYVLVLGIREALGLQFSSGALEGDVETRWEGTVGIGDRTYLMTTALTAHASIVSDIQNPKRTDRYRNFVGTKHRVRLRGGCNMIG